MYGQDSDKRYPGMQNEFFERAGDILSRRESLRAFIAAGEGGEWAPRGGGGGEGGAALGGELPCGTALPSCLPLSRSI